MKLRSIARRPMLSSLSQYGLTLLKLYFCCISAVYQLYGHRVENWFGNNLAVTAWVDSIFEKNMVTMWKWYNWYLAQWQVVKNQCAWNVASEEIIYMLLAQIVYGIGIHPSAKSIIRFWYARIFDCQVCKCWSMHSVLLMLFQHCITCNLFSYN